MKTNINIKKILSGFTLIAMLSTNLTLINTTNASSSKVVFPLKEVSTLECRYTDFSELSSKCKQKLPILNTRDYTKYIKQSGGYNEYTRFYTMLWWASYKYGWDVGFGGHQGTDIVTSKGTPVYSIADGKVINAKKMLGWGNTVTVEHLIEGKKIFSNYSHLSKISVKKGDKIKAGKKIGEVGSTGNSTGNHLHLQIDLDTPFHPFYYSRTTCPYSYSEITEKGVYFDDLATNTIDPLLFLETKGEIVKKLNIETNKVTVSKNSNQTSTINYSSNNISIWNKTVYIGYSKSDIREVQQILRDLELYNGSLTGDYKDIENIIFNFQVKSKILFKKTDLGAGWFGPKTRAALKKEYDKFIKSGKKHNYFKITGKTSTVNTGIVTQKIDRKHIKTREEIEQEEYEAFMRSYEFDLDIGVTGENIKVGTSSKIDLFIIKKSIKKSTYFNGVTPLDITIVTDNSIIEPFPKKFSLVRGGKREITLKGLKSGTTNVKIMFGKNIVKTYKVRVYSKNEKIYLESGMIYGKDKLVAGEREKGIALFKDKTKKRLIGVKYSGTYKIKGIGDTKVCIKRGSAKYISNIYKRKCRAEEYKNEITFTYDDTVSGILLFDYKSDTGNSGGVEIINTYNNSTLASKNLKIFAKNNSNISYLR